MDKLLGDKKEALLKVYGDKILLKRCGQPSEVRLPLSFLNSLLTDKRTLDRRSLFVFNEVSTYFSDYEIFLTNLSSRCGYITGQRLDIEGGWLLV